MNYQEIAKRIRRDILISSYEAGACHLGSALSCVDILVPLLYNPLFNGDFLFAKASGVATYYAILADQGVFPKEKLSYFLKNYPLPSKDVPGILHTFGSVGHGLSVATGLAYAKRNNVYVLLSDGDLQEGATFEAALFIRQHRLLNLHVLCDDNGIQACGKTKDILDLETAFEFYQKTIPNFTRCRTIKGSGVDFMEDDFRWHYKNLTKELLEKALCQI